MEGVFLINYKKNTHSPSCFTSHRIVFRTVMISKNPPRGEMMDRRTSVSLFLVAMVFAANQASPDTIASYELKNDSSDHSCHMTTALSGGKGPTLQISQYKGVWSLSVYVSDRSNVYRNYFDSRGLRDTDGFNKSFGTLRVGQKTFEFHEVDLMEVMKEGVDEKTVAIFKVNEKHNVSPILNSMDSGLFSIPGLVDVSDSSEPIGEFRSCAFEALGIREGERVETDYRAEYRMIFEGSFEMWIKSMARSEACLSGRFDEDAVDEVINRAASAFYPGLLSMGKRSEYKDDLKRGISIAKLTGYTDAKVDGCMMSDQLAEMSLLPVEKSIESAENID